MYLMRPQPFVILNGPNSVHTLDECNKLLAKYQNDEGGFCAMENNGPIRNEKIGIFCGAHFVSSMF